MNEEIINEKQDSIKVSRNGKGIFSWEIKRYYNEEKVKPEQIIKDIAKIDKELESKFNNRNDD